MKKLSIIIVNYNVCHFLEQALTSIKKAIEKIDAEVWVVDNNSVDGSVAMLKEKFSWIQLIENKQNLGFSKANNQAIRRSKSEYVLLLNPDTVVEEDTFEKCIRFMDENKQAGSLGVKMLDGRGNFLPESKRGLPSPMVAFYKIFGLAKMFPRSKRFGRYHLGYLDKDKTNEVDVLSGAYMFIRKEVLDKIGLLDEDYFMYGEDIDLSYRIIKGGYKNYYFPEARIIHYKGESTKKTSVNYVFIFYNAMIIFARKHFSNTNASLFSSLINMAIYVRAGMAIAARFIQRMLVPLADAALIFAGIYFIKEFWQTSFKKEPGAYPWEFMGVAVPAYIIIWIIASYYNGAYDRGAKPWGVARGIIIGTVLIAAVSNFADSYRFSKALIPIGGFWAFIAMSTNRLMLHFMQYKNFRLGEDKTKRIVIIGEEQECERVKDLIDTMNRNLQVVGFVRPAHTNSSANYLGDLAQIDEVLELYNIDEVIFCSKDIPAHNIIEWMTRINRPSLEFKIVPDNSNYVIGSNSKDAQGELYTVNIELNIIRKNQIRNKRVLDVMTSLVLLPVSPLLMWFMPKPFRFLENIFLVLIGRYTWVGFTLEHQPNLPKIKKGIIHPVCLVPKQEQTQVLVQNRNFVYARDYHPWMDIKLMFKSFRYLGA